MTHRDIRYTLAVMVALSGALLQAQEATFTVVPDSAPPGAGRTISVTAPPTSGIDYLAIGCQLQQIWSGGPNGTPTSIPGPVCAMIPMPLPPCGTVSSPWIAPASLAPGTWWLRFDYLLPGTFTAVTKWVDVRIDSPPEPTLTAPAPVTGQPWVINLIHPLGAGAPYVAAASLSTDSGQTISPSLLLSLDRDFLFLTSFPNPHPLWFTNFQGSLDNSGSATMALHIPNVPGINCVGLHVQAFVLAPGGGKLSNCLDMVIQ